jgi:hypothetical protein
MLAMSSESRFPHATAPGSLVTTPLAASPGCIVFDDLCIPFQGGFFINARRQQAVVLF